VLVYLPPSYERSTSVRRRYPTIYLLLAPTGRAQDWVRHGSIDKMLDRLAADRGIPECIAVMPDPGGPRSAGRARLATAHDRRFPFEDFVVHDLVKWVDQHFRTETTPERRLVVGITEGARSAVHLALRNSGVFGGCVGLSGEYRLADGRDLRTLLGLAPGLARAGGASREVLDLCGHQMRQLRFVLACGWLDRGVAHAWALHRLMEEVRITHTFRTYWGGRDWGRWRSSLSRALCELLAPALLLERAAVSALASAREKGQPAGTP
jgi:enterochelin esterase-like enzyme